MSNIKYEYYEYKDEDMGYLLTCHIEIKPYKDDIEFSLDPILMNGVACEFLAFGIVDRIAKKALEAYTNDYHNNKLCLDI